MIIVNLPMRISYACEMIKKALEKSKNDIFHALYVHISGANSKTIVSMINDIDCDLTKIHFCESCISAKISQI